MCSEPKCHHKFWELWSEHKHQWHRIIYTPLPLSPLFTSLLFLLLLLSAPNTYKLHSEGSTFEIRRSSSRQVFTRAVPPFCSGSHTTRVSLKLWLHSRNCCHFTTPAQSPLLFLAQELFHWSTPENSWSPSEDIYSLFLCNGLWILDGFNLILNTTDERKLNPFDFVSILKATRNSTWVNSATTLKWQYCRGLL